MTSNQARSQYKRIHWQLRTVKFLDQLQKRIYALSDKPYLGYGFHYAMVGEIAYLRTEITLPDLRWCNKAIARNLVLQVRVNALAEQVARAERGIDNE
jgi:hypothetical protein